MPFLKRYIDFFLRAGFIIKWIPFKMRGKAYFPLDREVFKVP